MLAEPSLCNAKTCLEFPAEKHVKERLRSSYTLWAPMASL